MIARTHIRAGAVLLSAFVLVALSAAAGRATAAAVSDITVIVPAGQTNGAAHPTLTGAGQYSYFAPTFDRAAKNNYANKAKLLGEVYLGDGGATATYTIKSLAPTPTKFSLWIYYSDDGLHSTGTRAVTVSIPELKWSAQWPGVSTNTNGWRAAKIGTVTASGNVTVTFTKIATTSAAFVMNAFGFTTGTKAPAFGAAPAAVTAPSGLWRLSINQRSYRFFPIRNGFEQRTVAAVKTDLGCYIAAGTAVYRYLSGGNGVFGFQSRIFQPRSGGAGTTGKNCTSRWTTSKASLKIIIQPATMTVSCIQSTVKAQTQAYTCYSGVYRRIGA